MCKLRVKVTAMFWAECAVLILCLPVGPGWGLAVLGVGESRDLIIQLLADHAARRIEYVHNLHYSYKHVSAVDVLRVISGGDYDIGITFRHEIEKNVAFTDKKWTFIPIYVQVYTWTFNVPEIVRLPAQTFYEPTFNLSFPALSYIYSLKFPIWNLNFISSPNPSFNFPNENILTSMSSEDDSLGALISQSIWQYSNGLNPLFGLEFVPHFRLPNERSLAAWIRSRPYALGLISLADASRLQLPSADLDIGSLNSVDINVAIAATAARMGSNLVANIYDIGKCLNEWVTEKKDRYCIAGFYYMMLRLHFRQADVKPHAFVNTSRLYRRVSQACIIQNEIYQFLRGLIHSERLRRLLVLNDLYWLPDLLDQKIDRFVLQKMTCEDLDGAAQPVSRISQLEEQLLAESRAFERRLRWFIPTVVAAILVGVILLASLGMLHVSLCNLLARRWLIKEEAVALAQTSHGAAFASSSGEARSRQCSIWSPNGVVHERMLGSKFVLLIPISWATVNRIHLFTRIRLEKYRQLRHKNLQRFYGLVSFTQDLQGLSSLVYYSVVARATRGTLMDKLQEEEDAFLDPSLKWALLREVATGLAYLHRSGLAHGNLGPRQIFIDSSYNVQLASWQNLNHRCMGYGGYFIGRNLSASEAWPDIRLHRSLTDSLSFVWRAPEQIDSILEKNHHAQTMTAASDIFSFGVLCWQVWSLKTPFAEEAREFEDQPLDFARLLISTRHHLRLLHEAPEQVADFLSKLLRENPSRRVSLNDVLAHIDSMNVELSFAEHAVGRLEKQLQRQMGTVAVLKKRMDLGQRIIRQFRACFLPQELPIRSECDFIICAMKTQGLRESAPLLADHTECVRLMMRHIYVFVTTNRFHLLRNVSDFDIIAIRKLQDEDNYNEAEICLSIFKSAMRLLTTLESELKSTGLPQLANVFVHLDKTRCELLSLHLTATLDQLAFHQPLPEASGRQNDRIVLLGASVEKIINNYAPELIRIAWLRKMAAGRRA